MQATDDRVGVVAVLVADLRLPWHAHQARAVLDSVAPGCDRVVADLRAGPGTDANAARALLEEAHPGLDLRVDGGDQGEWERLLSAARRATAAGPKRVWVVLPCSLSCVYEPGTRAQAARAAMAAAIAGRVPAGRRVWRMGAAVHFARMPDAGALVDPATDPVGLRRVLLTHHRLAGCGAEAATAGVAVGRAGGAVCAVGLTALQLVLAACDGALLDSLERLPGRLADAAVDLGGVPTVVGERVMWYDRLPQQQVRAVTERTDTRAARAVPCEWLDGATVDGALRSRGAVLGVRIGPLPGGCVVLGVDMVLRMAEESRPAKCDEMRMTTAGGGMGVLAAFGPEGAGRCELLCAPAANGGALWSGSPAVLQAIWRGPIVPLVRVARTGTAERPVAAVTAVLVPTEFVGNESGLVPIGAGSDTGGTVALLTVPGEGAERAHFALVP